MAAVQSRSCSKATATGLVGSLPTFAAANGAMGLGLEQWDLRYWFAYVAATVVFEAWFIGRRLGLDRGRSAAASLIGNLITGGCCAGGGLFAPFLHSASLNPNPIGDAVMLLTFFAIPSACVESIVWRSFMRGGTYRANSDSRIVGQSILAHLIGVPLALIILLIPNRPYVGMEGLTAAHRRFAIMLEVKEVLESEIARTKRVPDLSPQAMEQLISSTGANPDLWTALYLPDFHRFDTGEARRVPLEWNAAVAGRKIGGPDDWQWIFRPPASAKAYPLFINLGNGELSTHPDG